VASTGVDTRGLDDVRRTLEALTALQGSTVAVAAPGTHEPRSVSRARSGKKPRAYSRLSSFSRRRILIADLIRIHEYGLGVPKRPFVRMTLQGKRAEIDKTIEGAIQRVIGSKGKWGGAKAHSLVGRRVVAELRRTLAARVPPPLSPATMADPDRDKRGIPLVDTGQIRDSLTWRSEGL